MIPSTPTKYLATILGASLISLASFSAHTNQTPQKLPTPQAEPRLSQTQHQDWVLICEQQTEQKHCHMQQTLSVQQGEQTQHILQAIVTRQDEQRLLEIIVPLGVDLRPGLLIQVDENPVGATPYLTCNAGGCITILSLDHKLWRQMRAGQKTKIGIRGLGETENTVLELSLKGFTAASNGFISDDL